MYCTVDVSAAWRFVDVLGEKAAAGRWYYVTGTVVARDTRQTVCDVRGTSCGALTPQRNYMQTNYSLNEEPHLKC